MPLDPPVARTLSARLRPAQCLVALLLVALLASCATTPSAVPATSAVRFAPAFANAATLARQDAALSGQARADNGNEIDRLLATLDDATLARDAAALPSGDPLYTFAGRALQRRGLPLPRPFDRGSQWRFDAGNRPPADSDGYRPPVKLAVLLPLSGNLATAAAPVRDGLLAGYYGERRRRPEIQFYDTTGTAAGATAAYARATAEGADFVVGPLGRDEVSALFQQPELATPMLVLNRGTVAPPDGKAGFSLAPEDDGIAAAEYMLSRKARRVLVLQGADDALRRSTTAFREHLAAAGIGYEHRPALGCPMPVRNQYRADGDWADYTRGFLAHLDTVKTEVRSLAAIVRDHRACLVCFEADFSACHRTYVARAVRRAGGPAVHHLSARTVVADAPASLAA